MIFCRSKYSEFTAEFAFRLKKVKLDRRVSLRNRMHFPRPWTRPSTDPRASPREFKSTASMSVASEVEIRITHRVCPFARIEGVLQGQYGEGVIIMVLPGSIEADEDRRRGSPVFSTASV
jgi:hypothetical protein